MPLINRKIIATCTVGDGPDVLIVDTSSIGDMKLNPKTVYTDLSVDQARDLARQLMLAALSAEEFYDSYERWCLNDCARGRRRLVGRRTNSSKRICWIYHVSKD